MGVVVRRLRYIYIYYRFPHNITYPSSTCINSFLQQHNYIATYFLVHLKIFFHSFIIITQYCLTISKYTLKLQIIRLCKFSDLIYNCSWLLANKHLNNTLHFTIIIRNPPSFYSNMVTNFYLLVIISLTLRSN